MAKRWRGRGHRCEQFGKLRKGPCSGGLVGVAFADRKCVGDHWILQADHHHLGSGALAQFAARAENNGVHASVFCLRIVDAIGKVGLSETEYLLFSITVDNLLLAPPAECDVEYDDLKSAMTAIIDLIVNGAGLEEIKKQICLMSAAVERIIVLSHTQNAAQLLFKEG
ncbi:hypothetical protein M1D34_30050 (plasmid) [Ensifer sp. D2-11]